MATQIRAKKWFCAPLALGWNGHSLVTFNDLRCAIRHAHTFTVTSDLRFRLRLLQKWTNKALGSFHAKKRLEKPGGC